MDSKKIENLIVELLKAIGENPDRLGLKDTPKRVAKMYQQLFKGYDKSKAPVVTVFENGKDGISYDGMIIDQGYFFSLCEHHMIPFFGDYYLGYIPNKCIVGASKIARVIDYFSAKLQIQERLCQEVVNYLYNVLQPCGIILLMRGRHLCKEMRGVKKYNGMFETIALKGCFKNNIDGCKDEFMSRIGLK